MGAKTIAGYSSKLVNILEPSDRVIPIEDRQSLLNRLDDGDFTTLLIQDTVGYEVVKVMNYRGDIVIDRGLDGTKPKRFPIGSCVSFVPSEELFKAMVCETECCDIDEDYGKVADNPNVITANLPNKVVGGIDAVLGSPTGFMLINGKKVPFYE